MRYRLLSLYPCAGFGTLQGHRAEFAAQVEALETRGWTRQGEGIVAEYGHGLPPDVYAFGCTLEGPPDPPAGAGILTGERHAS